MKASSVSDGLLDGHVSRTAHQDEVVRDPAPRLLDVVVADPLELSRDEQL